MTALLDGVRQMALGPCRNSSVLFFPWPWTCIFCSDRDILMHSYASVPCQSMHACVNMYLPRRIPQAQARLPPARPSRAVSVMEGWFCCKSLQLQQQHPNRLAALLLQNRTMPSMGHSHCCTCTCSRLGLPHSLLCKASRYRFKLELGYL